MDESDIVDDVNALLNLGVGDAYRLEHIKQSYIENKTIWITDQRYLENMKKKYLIKHSNIQEESEEKTEDTSEDEEKIHCWKCGKKSNLGANFCMVCGAPLYDVATDSEMEREEIPHQARKKSVSVGWKIPVMIGVPVLILAIIGGAYSQGYFDSSVEKTDSPIDNIPTNIADTPKTVTNMDTGNSKCGPGTVFDSETNSCVLEGKSGSEETEEKSTPTDSGHSKCGPGTILVDGACVLDKWK